MRSFIWHDVTCRTLSFLVAGVVTSVTFSNSLFADFSGYRLQPIVVTASVWAPPQPPLTHHTALSVDSTRSKGLVSIESFISTITGIDSINAGGQISVFGQGAASYQSRVLFNGLDLKDSSSVNGSPNFDGLNAYTIDAIDVLRGAQTAQYGPNTIGGVLNFQSNPIGTHTHIVAGDRYSNVGIKTASQFGDIVVSGGINRFEDSRLSSKTTLPDLDPITSVNKFGRLEWQGETQRWTAQLLAIDTTAFIDGYSGTISDERLRTRSTRWGSTYENRLNAQWSWGGNFQETHVTRESIDGSDSAIYIGTTQKLDAYLQWTAPTQQLRVGIDTYQDDGSSKTPYDSTIARTVTSTGWYAGYNAQHDAVRLAASSRVQSDPLTSVWRIVGGLDASVSLNANATVIGTIQSGVRHPSVYETSRALTNGSLASDQSLSKAIGINWTGWIGTQSLRWFESTVDQPIDYYYGNDQTEGYYNQPGNAISRGVEVTSEFTFPGHLPLSIRYTTTDTFGSSGKTPRVPVYKWVISGGIDTGYATFGVTIRSVGGYRDTSYSEAEVAGYGLTDITLRYTHTKWIQPFVTVTNVFDHQYQPVIGYPALGRSLMIGFETRLD